MSASLVINFVVFQVGWIVAVAGAAYGLPFAGVVYALAFVVGHHWLLGNGRAAELLFVALSGVLGYIVDSLLVVGGFMVFPDYTWVGYPTTVWMISLWVMFAMTLRHSLGWLRGRYLLAAALGAVAGPLAYWAGSKLGAVELARQPGSLIAIGVAWTVSMILLLRIELLTRALPRARTT